MTLTPIILSGGAGTRLWPASRAERPKQFLPLISHRSTFQATVLRMHVACSGAVPIIVIGERHVSLAQEQLAAIEIPAQLIVEPEGRDSGPAIAAAAVFAYNGDPDAVAIVVASDHYLPDESAFSQAVARAAIAARKGAIVTFGMTPTEPSSAYGYIDAGPAPWPGAPDALLVKRFIEKPDVETARDYLRKGHLWNSGNFVFRASKLLSELETFEPEMKRRCEESVLGGVHASGVFRLGPAFKGAPKISIDYAVMERTKCAAMVPLEADWSDLGSWKAVRDAAGRDDNGNAAQGDAVIVDSSGCLVRTSGDVRVALLGVKDIAVVVDKGDILVCNLEESQRVKEVASVMGAPNGASGSGASDATPAMRLRGLAQRFDQWLRTSALPLWWCMGADHVRGGFVESLDHAGRPTDAAPRARVQARQIFTYATAGRLGWAGPWSQAVAHGWSYFDGLYRRKDHAYRTLVSRHGEPVDETAYVYDQAFALLAMACSAAGGGHDWEPKALRLLAWLEDRAHPGGGYRETAPARPFQSNPHMHLFEAALAWEAVGKSDVWRKMSDSIANLALTRFIDQKSGFLREFFDADWTPAEGEDGEVVEPGHQFEWAWLLARWASARGHEGGLRIAQGLVDIAERHGVDRRRGVAVDAMNASLNITNSGARLWPQTERLKANLLFASIAGETVQGGVHLTQAEAAAVALQSYLSTTPGLWRDKMSSDGKFLVEPAPASSFYHIVAAIESLLAWEQTG